MASAPSRPARALLAFAEHPRLPRAVAARLGLPCLEVEVHRFPDGESRVRVPHPAPEEALLCRSLDRPNDKLVELLLCCEALREAGTRRITLVAPYLCYMRQDAAFRPGEAVSQRIVGRWLGGLVDRLVTVDPHLHRTHRLEEAVPGAACTTLSAAPLMAELLRALPARPLLVAAPDEEAGPWARRVAGLAGLPCLEGRKRRRGDREVEVSLPAEGVAGATVAVVDDVVSSGGTLAQAARRLRAAGAREVLGLVTHALPGTGFEALLEEAGMGTLWSSNSVPHPSNRMDLSGLLAEALA